MPLAILRMRNKTYLQFLLWQERQKLTCAGQVYRVATCFATMLWAAVILLERDGFWYASASGMAFVSKMLGLTEDFVAIFFGSIALIQFLRWMLIDDLRTPFKILDGILVFFWLYSAVGILVYTRPIPALNVAGSTTVFCLAYMNLRTRGKGIPAWAA